MTYLQLQYGHFPKTPLKNGNICLAAHNSGTNKNNQYVGYFDLLYTLIEGDEIIYNDLENDYIYKVISNTVIKDTDMSVIDNTDKNILTLVTCVNGKENRNFRQCVIAEIEY